MNDDDLKSQIIDFFENIQKYYGSKTEITEGLTSNFDVVDAQTTT